MFKLNQYRALACSEGFKPIPDEEGTEMPEYSVESDECLAGFKPIPDEEGTEIVNLSPEDLQLKIELQTDPR